jgi:hypothetical protein
MVPSSRSIEVMGPCFCDFRRFSNHCQFIIGFEDEEDEERLGGQWTVDSNCCCNPLLPLLPPTFDLNKGMRVKILRSFQVVAH